MMVEQFRQPQRFLASARRAHGAGKPIVLLHPGRSAAARASAQTHTGAMSGDYEVMRALVAHAGVAVVDTLEELHRSRRTDDPLAVAAARRGRP